jgi:C4-dicarboxylate-specific signal transduction histidine kinase
VSFTSIDEASSQLQEAVSGGIVLLDLAQSLVEPDILLTALRGIQHQHPSYIILLGKPENEETLLHALSLGARDFFLHPINEKVFEAKLLLGSTVVNDKRALIDASQVLERYAMHIDRIASERAMQLFHSERLSTIGTMSASLAHEINTPIGYITTSLETAKIYWDQVQTHLEGIHKEVDPSSQATLTKILERMPKSLNRINTGLDKIDKLMGGLKDFARSSHGERVESSINTIVEMALDMCESTIKYHVTVEKKLGEDIPLALVDPQQVEQILINLLVNASHAMEEQDAGEITIQTFSDEREIVLVVEDNGSGIPEDQLESIWQPFYTTKEVGKGTGLGLAICKNLVRDNGGKIEVKNGEAGGARFEIRFRQLSK